MAVLVLAVRKRRIMAFFLHTGLVALVLMIALHAYLYSSLQLVHSKKYGASIRSRRSYVFLPESFRAANKDVFLAAINSKSLSTKSLGWIYLSCIVVFLLSFLGMLLQPF
jgi:hypothetical protein